MNISRLRKNDPLLNTEERRQEIELWVKTYVFHISEQVELIVKVEMMDF